MNTSYFMRRVAAAALSVSFLVLACADGAPAALAFTKTGESIEYGLSVALSSDLNRAPGASAKWSSADPTVASVDQAGKAIALKAGTTVVSVVDGGQTATLTLTVLPLEFVSVSAGFYHACGVTKLGTGYCWGDNSYGTLGDGTTTPSLVPRPVNGGSLRFSLIDVGQDHACGKTTGGAVYCWGYNNYGQVGDGTKQNTRSTPVLVPGVTSPIDIGAGENHTCALMSSGQVMCWGGNTYGQLGDQTTTDRLSPVVVSGQTTFKALSVGARHNCGTLANNQLYCWGSNSGGQLGDGTKTDRTSPVFTQFVGVSATAASIGAGRSMTCAALTNGGAYCWGITPTATQTRPTLVSGAPSSGSVVGGGLHACGISTAAAAYCWGWNGGALGNGDIANSDTPVLVAGGLSFSMITVSWNDFTCGIATTGKSYCWGKNAAGALGDGTQTTRTSPQEIAGQR